VNKESRHRFIIDRIEDDIAVIVLYDDDSVKFNLPVRYLPQKVKGGDHLQVTFKVDPESRKELKKRIEELLKDE
jgi:hypothetical protein